MSRLAIIAGAGSLPAAVDAELTLQGQPRPVICALDGATLDGLAVDLTFQFERLAPFLRALADQGVDRVVLAGAMHRPTLDPSLFDRETASFVPALMAALSGGDDAALRWVIDLIEAFDLQVVGLADAAPGLLAGADLPSHRAPTKAERRDAERATLILDALGPVDVAQGCVVGGGLCLGIESIYGTDALLDDVRRHRPERVPHKGGVFVKRAKAGQDLRADLPTIGPATIEAALRAGLTAICLQADRVVILDRHAVLAAAEAADMALWAQP